MAYESLKSVWIRSTMYAVMQAAAFIVCVLGFSFSTTYATSVVTVATGVVASLAFARSLLIIKSGTSLVGITAYCGMMWVFVFLRVPDTIFGMFVLFLTAIVTLCAAAIEVGQDSDLPVWWPRFFAALPLFIGTVIGLPLLLLARKRKYAGSVDSH